MTSSVIPTVASGVIKALQNSSGYRILLILYQPGEQDGLYCKHEGYSIQLVGWNMYEDCFAHSVWVEGEMVVRTAGV
jgi:hypothetical protein